MNNEEDEEYKPTPEELEEARNFPESMGFTIDDDGHWRPASFADAFYDQEVEEIIREAKAEREFKRQSYLNSTGDVGPDPSNYEMCEAYEEMQGYAPWIFITGKAGTGKSHLLRHFIQHTSKCAVVLAPTGVAALNVGGQTMHSFFRFPEGILDKENDIRFISKSSSSNFYQDLDTIIIDEASMVNANLMDAVDWFMRRNGPKASEPFGGVQMILFGDLFQLPPVVEDETREYFLRNYQSEFFFDAHVFSQARLWTFELQKNYRQKDKVFIDILNAVRTNSLSDEQRCLLNSRVQSDFEPPDDEFYVTLTTKNYSADAINNRRLRDLPAPEFSYEGNVWGEFSERVFPTSRILHLRVGAQVILLRNDPAKRWVNGTFGRIKNLGPDSVEVEIMIDDCPVVYPIERETWQKYRYTFDHETGRVKRDVVGEFEQYPIRLAWAITIHKSQGQTYDNVVIDFSSGAWEHGQVYVALSRCRTLQGITLKTEVRWSDMQEINRRVMGFTRCQAKYSGVL
jgi:hypothetical protein